ncbi:hypothetical protein ES708_11888 [subsurface metagenome]
MIPGKKYDPGTRTSRRPTPERFEHLRRWIEPIERSISMTSIEQLTNINQQLDQSSAFYISTIISRVIAQLVAVYGDGFVSLKGTEAGALTVKLSELAAETLVLAAGANLIGSVQLAGPAQEVTSAKIDFALEVHDAIVAAQPLKRIKITSFMFTVGGDVGITLMSGATALTGKMAFGGDNEPRGMVSNHGYVPLVLGVNEAFIIATDADVQVSGYVTGYIE